MGKVFNIKSCLYTCLILLCVMGACDDVNDWEVDESYKGLFRPLTFEKVVNDATTVTLRYSRIVSAKKYLFEFYKDSTEFLPNNYVRTDTILADTLTIATDSKDPMGVKYLTVFKDLDGATQYSIRMKGVNKEGVASQYMELAFKTAAEQIFENIERTTNSATLYWAATSRVTHLLLYQLINPSKGTYGDPETIELTEEDIATNSKMLPDLVTGTGYKVKICNENAVRGEYVFKTLGLGNAEVIKVPASIDENDLINLDNLLVGITASNLTFEFEVGKSYYFSTIKLPVVDNVLFTSTSTDEENRPRIFTKNIILTSPIESMAFEYINLDAMKNDMFIEMKNTFGSITFEGCVIQNVGRSIVRLNGSIFRVTDITFNNSILSRIGTNGYGMFTINRNNDVVLNRFAITNCTLIDMGERLMETYGTVDLVLIENCTLYGGNELAKSLGHLFRFNNIDPGAVKLRNNILSGPNGGSTINPGYSDYQYLDFSDNNYMTSDMRPGNKKFIGITQLEQASDDIFVNPTEGDFHIKPGAGFSGAGNAGDPRWW
ncbi:DUF5123 domain-containing protein [Bacteroides congonensis]